MFFSFFSVFKQCIDALESLKAIKSSIEECDADVSAPTISEDDLVELKQQILMHVPSSLTDEARQKIFNLTQKTFQGLYLFHKII